MSRTVYDYADASGSYVFSVVVDRSTDGEKRVAQGVRAPDGSIVWGLNGIAEPPLYRLPELLAHIGEGRRDPIWIVEGEKCVEALRALGLTATTNPMGAGKWRGWHTDSFIGAWATRVVADLDDPGRAHARAVFAEVGRVVADSEALQPPADLGDGADVSDLLAAGRSLDELQPLDAVSPTGDTVPAGPPRSRTRLTRLSTVKPRAIRWLDPGLVQIGNLNLVAGIGGMGKSTWLMGVVARLTRGDLTDGEAGTAIVVSFEDRADEVLRPRIEAARGDLDRVFTMDVSLDAGGMVVLPRDLAELERHVRDVDARLVVIDPIVAAIDLTLDAHRDQDVRSVLAQLVALAGEKEFALAAVGHLNKAPTRDAYLRIANSTAFYNAARSVVLVTPDPTDPERDRLLTQTKANYSRLVPVQRHRIEEILLDYRDPVTGQQVVTSRLVYVEDADDVDRDDVLGDHRSAPRTTEAIEFLRDALADGDWHDSAGLKTLAPVSEPTLKRAAQELRVEYDSRGFPRSTYWRLPQSDHALPTKREPTGDEDGNPHG